MLLQQSLGVTRTLPGGFGQQGEGTVFVFCRTPAQQIHEAGVVQGLGMSLGAGPEVPLQGFALILLYAIFISYGIVNGEFVLGVNNVLANDT